MFKGMYSLSSSSDSSEDEDEGIMLAQLNRNKRSAPEDEVDDSDASVPSVQTEGVSSTSSDHGNWEVEGEEVDLQEPRDLEQVLLDEVVPSKLKDVWMGGRSQGLWMMKMDSRNRPVLFVGGDKEGMECN